MTLILLAVVANIVAAGFDCVSTIKHLTPDTELNPVARRLMRWCGMLPAVSIIYVVICGFSLSLWALCVILDATTVTALCALFLFVEAVLHASAAHVNTTGGYNRWTRPLLAPVLYLFAAWERASRGRWILIACVALAPLALLLFFL